MLQLSNFFLEKLLFERAIFVLGRERAKNQEQEGRPPLDHR